MRRTSSFLFGLALSAIGLGACGSATVASGSPKGVASQSSPTKPIHVFPIPSGVISASSPLPNGTLWVLAGNASSKGIFQIDLGTGKVVASVSVSNSASAIAQSQSGDVGLGLSTQGGGAVEFHSGLTGGLVSTVALPGSVVAICAGSDGKTFYALVQVGSSLSVDTISDAANKVISSVPAPSGAVSLVVTPSERHVYVVQGNGVATEIATSNGQIGGQFRVGGSGHFAYLSNDGSTLYVLKGKDPIRNVAVVDLATESVLKVLPAAGSSVGLALSPDDSQLYDLVGNSAYGNIQVFKLN